MSEQPFERLAYQNRFVKHLIQQTEGTDCFVPFVNLNEAENLVVLKLSAAKINRMFSALITGADITYPDESMQIMVDFLSGIHCPPVMEAQDCYEYPTYGSFISYTPNNPYLTPGEIPEGYAATPFLVNGQDGVSVPNYDDFDILVPVDALTLDVNWFEDIAGQLPTIQVLVQGAGKVFLKMLTYPGGGLAVVTVDNPPNLLDILAGIVTGAENIMDLNQDIISLPPETAQEIIFETDTVGPGLHTIYIVFLPILDDSLIPLRFGGGFRGVQLCDFVEQPLMGIQDIRFNDATCNLEVLEDGEWAIVSGWENWLDCVPSGGGGGGGGGAFATTHKQDLGAATVTSTATSAAGVTGSSFNHTFTKSKAIVICHAYVQHSGASAVCQIRANVAGATFVDNSYQEWIGTNLRVLAIANSFELISAGVHAITLTWFTSGGTMTMNNSSFPQFIILEFDDASELFVEDIRIVDGELQKKIAGAWIPVTESLAALLDTIAAAAAAAQVDANTALTQNIAQQTQINAAVTVNNLQNTRLDDLETFQADAAISFLGIQAQLDNHESRIDALEASEAGGVWSHEIDFTADDDGWTGNDSAGWFASDGWLSSSGTGILEISKPSVFISDQRVTHMKLWLRATGGATPNTYLVSFAEYSAVGGIYLSSTGTLITGWYKVPNRDGAYFPYIRVYSNPTVNDFQLERVQFLGRGFSPF